MTQFRIDDKMTFHQWRQNTVRTRDYYAFANPNTTIHLCILARHSSFYTNHTLYTGAESVLNASLRGIFIASVMLPPAVPLSTHVIYKFTLRLRDTKFQVRYRYSSGRHPRFSAKKNQAKTFRYIFLKSRIGAVLSKCSPPAHSHISEINQKCRGRCKLWLICMFHAG